MLRNTLLGLLCVSAATPAFAGATIEPLKTDRVAANLGYPTAIVHAPGDATRLFIVEKNGLIKIMNLSDYSINATPFLNIVSIVQGGASTGDEQGLLGLTFHPDYATNGYFYVNYTSIAGGGDTVVARYRVSGDPNIADPANPATIITFDQPFANHNGGWIDFGPDGYLYIATGDGGDGNDPGNRAQDITSQKLGKMLRLDVNGVDGVPGTDDDDGDDDAVDSFGGYTSPLTNPFVGETGDDEIWAYGLRNPWRCSFDRVTGDLYIGDVGQGAWEEINFQPASSLGGENYGWRCMEGNHCTGLSGCTCEIGCAGGPLTCPIREHAHNASGGNSITGGVVYRGCAIPSLYGYYIWADYTSGNIWTLKVVDGAATEVLNRKTELQTSIDGFTCNQIVAFGEDANGEVYIADHGGATSGQIFKLIPAESLDCNANGIDDDCDIASGEADENANGIPDVCEAPSPDINDDGVVDGADLGLILGAWGTCAKEGECASDLDGNGEVDGADLGILLGNWTE